MLDEIFQLSLICAVSFTVTDSSMSMVSPGYGNPPVMAQRSTSREASGELMLAFDQDSRMRLPHQLVSGRDNGWRELKSIVVADNKINARFNFEMTVGGRVEVDRISGDIRVQYGNVLWGHKQIIGRCDRYEAPTERRF